MLETIIVAFLCFCTFSVLFSVTMMLRDSKSNGEENADEVWDDRETDPSLERATKSLIHKAKIEMQLGPTRFFHKALRGYWFAVVFLAIGYLLTVFECRSWITYLSLAWSLIATIYAEAKKNMAIAYENRIIHRKMNVSADDAPPRQDII